MGRWQWVIAFRRGGLRLRIFDTCCREDVENEVAGHWSVFGKFSVTIVVAEVRPHRL